MNLSMNNIACRIEYVQARLIAPSGIPADANFVDCIGRLFN
jgi:hypothetical protein